MPFAKLLLIWSKLSEAGTMKRLVSVLMAVPTIYRKLLEEIEKQLQHNEKDPRCAYRCMRRYERINGLSDINSESLGEFDGAVAA